MKCALKLLGEMPYRSFELILVSKATIKTYFWIWISYMERFYQLLNLNVVIDVQMISDKNSFFFLMGN